LPIASRGELIEAKFLCRNRVHKYATLSKMIGTNLSSRAATVLQGDTDGWLGFPFSRLKTDDRFPKLARDLNAAFGTNIVVATDYNRKGIGADVADLFTTPDHLDRFFAVWAAFCNATT
jgi:hypothetical protein